MIVNEHIEIANKKESLREAAQAFSRGGTGHGEALRIRALVMRWPVWRSPALQFNVRKTKWVNMGI